MGLSVENKRDGTNKRAKTEIKTVTVPCAKQKLACTTLGSASAMLTIVMDVKTMTQRVPMSRLNIVNGTTAGQGTWRCGLPAKFFGENVGAGVDGFEKNASQNTRRPCAQPVNFCLECLFKIKLLETQMKSRRILL